MVVALMISTLSGNLTCCGSSSQTKLFLCFDIQGTNSQNIKHLSCIINLLVSVIHITKCLPEGLAFKLSFLESTDDFTIRASSRIGVGTSTSRCLDLFDQSFILFIEHSNISLQTVCLSLHIAIDLCPFVLLFARDLVLLRDQLSHLIALLQELTFLLLELSPEATTLVFESIRWAFGSNTGVHLKLSNAVPHKLILSLKCIVLTTHQTVVVRVGAGQVALMVEPLVQAANGVLLCLNLTAVVLDHCIALMLQTLVLSLGLQELPLKLF